VYRVAGDLAVDFVVKDALQEPLGVVSMLGVVRITGRKDRERLDGDAVVLAIVNVRLLGSVVDVAAAPVVVLGSGPQARLSGCHHHRQVRSLGEMSVTVAEQGVASLVVSVRRRIGVDVDMLALAEVGINDAGHPVRCVWIMVAGSHDDMNTGKPRSSPLDGGNPRIAGLIYDTAEPAIHVEDVPRLLGDSVPTIAVHEVTQVS